jgi:hypothetical protein
MNTFYLLLIIILFVVLLGYYKEHFEQAFVDMNLYYKPATECAKFTSNNCPSNCVPADCIALKENFRVADDVNIFYPCCTYKSDECPKDRCSVIDGFCVRKERLGCNRCRMRRFY